MSIADTNHAVPTSLNPAQRKAATIALLVDEIFGFGDTDPVLLIVEDAHWIDATTLELMTRMAHGSAMYTDSRNSPDPCLQ